MGGCHPSLLFIRSCPFIFLLLFDGLAIVLYEYLITFNTPSSPGSFYELALPITGIVTLLADHHSGAEPEKSVILPRATALYLFAEVAVLCVSIELLIRRFFCGALYAYLVCGSAGLPVPLSL